MNQKVHLFETKLWFRRVTSSSFILHPCNFDKGSPNYIKQIKGGKGCREFFFRRNEIELMQFYSTRFLSSWKFRLSHQLLSFFLLSKATKSPIMEFYPFEPNWKTLTFFSRVRKTLQCKNDDSFVPTFFAAVSQTSLALLGNLCTVKTLI